MIQARVIAHPHSRVDEVSVDENGILHVYTRALPQEDKANKAIIKLLATHFNTSPSCVILQKGGTQKQKTFLIHL